MDASTDDIKIDAKPVCDICGDNEPTSTQTVYGVELHVCDECGYMAK
jgi:ribosome-binding protein aMBF1 (putative translation factor)